MCHGCLKKLKPAFKDLKKFRELLGQTEQRKIALEGDIDHCPCLSNILTHVGGNLWRPSGIFSAGRVNRTDIRPQSKSSSSTQKAMRVCPPARPPLPQRCVRPTSVPARFFHFSAKGHSAHPNTDFIGVDPGRSFARALTLDREEGVSAREAIGMVAGICFMTSCFLAAFIVAGIVCVGFDCFPVDNAKHGGR
jgi:hypothetical protein